MASPHVESALLVGRMFCNLPTYRSPVGLTQPWSAGDELCPQLRPEIIGRMYERQRHGRLTGLAPSAAPWPSNRSRRGGIPLLHQQPLAAPMPTVTLLHLHPVEVQQ